MPNTKTYSASDIAKYFIYLANSEHKPITNKKLQKLLYYAQAWSVSALKKPLFTEKVEAWIHGPAIPEIYSEYKEFGGNPIVRDIVDSEVETIQGKDKELLNEVWSVYGRFDGDYLEALTHSETPWLQARQGLEANASSTNEITPESMREFYTPKLLNNKN